MHVRIARWFLSAALFTFAFIVNPAFIAGCTPDDDGPSAAQRARAQADLRAKLDIIDGTPSWKMTQGDDEYEVFLALEHAKGPPAQAQRPSFTAVAHACGSYTLYNTASACGTSYLMPLEGTLTVKRLRDGATIVEDLEITGIIDSVSSTAQLDFGDDGQLNLSFDYENEDSYSLGFFRAAMLGVERINFNYTGA